MRLALVSALFASALLLTIPLVCAKTGHNAARSAAERQVNARLDRQLHATLHRLIATPAVEASVTSLPAVELTRR